MAVGNLYVMTFTSSCLEAEELRLVVQIAERQLSGKDARFQQRMADVSVMGRSIEVANMQYVATMHSPQTMQTALGGWMRRQYQVEFGPEIGENFFPHGMHDPQGKPNFFLFYFDDV